MRVCEREDDTSFQRVAAVWTLARHWTPPKGQSSEQIQDFIMGLVNREIKVPSDLAQEWCAQNASAICALETAAMFEAQDIKETLRGIYLDFQVERQEYDPKDLSDHLLGVLNRRDILESFTCALQAARSAIESGKALNPYRTGYVPGEGLSCEVGSLDHFVARIADFIQDNVNATEDLRCRKAGIADPDCWWGRLAYPD